MKEKFCQICSSVHYKRGVTCSNFCAGILRSRTAIQNGSEKLRRQKISATLKSKSKFEKNKITELRKQTFFEKYGSTVGWGNDQIREKMYQTKVKNDTAPYSKSVLNKQLLTKKKNDTLPSSKRVIKKSLETFYSHGSDFINNVVRKRHETYMKNGTGTKSKPADSFFSLFSSLDLVREYQVVQQKSWFIDFYSPKCDIYVQFDGSYWHGLNHHRITERVQRHIDADKKQNQWFEENNLNFYRISDVDFSKLQASLQNSLNSGNIQKLDNPELCLEMLNRFSYFKTSATTIEKQLKESDESNLVGTSRVDQKIDRNREIFADTEISKNKI